MGPAKGLASSKGVKPGLIPVFRDGDDGSAYRRKVADWIVYMSAVSEAVGMSLRQQFYALVMNDMIPIIKNRYLSSFFDEQNCLTYAPKGLTRY